jgi:hypothetical protein
MKQSLLAVRAQVQSYEVPDNIDLIDLCSLLGQPSAGTQIAQSCQQVIEAAQSGYMLQ